jgi:hypothetical protein
MAGSHVQIELKDGGKLVQVTDANGRKAVKKRKGPTGTITSTKAMVYVTVETDDPAPQCWFCYGGNWYRVC